MILEVFFVFNSNQLIRFGYFMNVPKDLNDLWHDNDFLNDFLQNERDFHEDLFLEWDLVGNSLDLLDDLDDFFDVVNVFDDFFHLFHNGDSLNNSFDFDHLGSDVGNRDYFLLLDFDFSHFFNYSWHFNYFLYQFLNVLVYFYHLRNYSLDFNYFWDFYQFLNQFLHFVNSWHSCRPLNDFFYDLLCCYDLLDFGLDCYYFFHDCRHFLYDLLNIRNNFFYFLDSLVDNNLFNNLLNLLNSDGLLFCFDDFLDELRYLDDLLQDLSHRNKFLYNNFHRDWDLFRDNYCSWYFNWSYDFVESGHNFFDVQCLWNFIYDFDSIFHPNFMNDSFFLLVGYCD